MSRRWKLRAALVAAALAIACGGDGLFGRNLPPTADAGLDVNSRAGVEVQFDGTKSSDPDGPLVSWKWEFGDGATAEGESVKHAFTAAGDFIVKLTVTDADGAEASDTVVAHVAKANAAPVAQIDGPSEVLVNADVIFDAVNSTDEDGEIVAWAWEFSDGGTGSSKAVAHVFTATGAFTAKLRVTDDEGATGETQVTIRVKQQPVVQPPASSNWTWKLVNPGQANAPGCGSFQAAALRIDISGTSIRMTESGGLGGSTVYSGTFTAATRAFSATNQMTGGTQTIRGTFNADFTKFDGFYDVEVALLGCNATGANGRAVTGTRQ